MCRFVIQRYDGVNKADEMSKTSGHVTAWDMILVKIHRIAYSREEIRRPLRRLRAGLKTVVKAGNKLYYQLVDQLNRAAHIEASASI
jgi:hypothetical protein